MIHECLWNTNMQMSNFYESEVFPLKTLKIKLEAKNLPTLHLQ